MGRTSDTVDHFNMIKYREGIGYGSEESRENQMFAWTIVCAEVITLGFALEDQP